MGGPQDLTYLAVDLPGQLARTLRVRRPGPGWGVAGYSEGGYCAANMALRFPRGYGAAGVLSGYFAPFDNRLSATGPLVSPFGGSSRLREQNTPLDELQTLSAATAVPRFWLGAGAADGQAVAAAETFRAELLPRQGSVPLTLTPGGGHTMTTWRAELPPMLSWMTLRLEPSTARVARPSFPARTCRALGGPPGTVLGTLCATHPPALGPRTRCRVSRTRLHWAADQVPRITRTPQPRPPLQPRPPARPGRHFQR